MQNLVWSLELLSSLRNFLGSTRKSRNTVQSIPHHPRKRKELIALSRRLNYNRLYAVNLWILGIRLLWRDYWVDFVARGNLCRSWKHWMISQTNSSRTEVFSSDVWNMPNDNSTLGWIIRIALLRTNSSLSERYSKWGVCQTRIIFKHWPDYRPWNATGRPVNPSPPHMF